MPNERPDFPYDELRAASTDPEHHAALESFRDEYARETPDSSQLHVRAESMRRVPPFVGPFERWWLNPRVQEFFAELSATGL